jgi:signal-transduction protein with cAMP-binding, CBS, and nucleotidyltransferase domain
MKVRQLLHDSPPASLAAEATVLEATRKMVEYRCGSVLVLDARGRMAGIFTERDLMVRVVSKARSPKNLTLGEVMTSEVFSVHPDQLVTDVRRELRERHIRHVPVLEDGEILGVLSMRDLLRADFEETRDNAKALDAYIRGEFQG